MTETIPSKNGSAGRGHQIGLKGVLSKTSHVGLIDPTRWVGPPVHTPARPGVLLVRGPPLARYSVRPRLPIQRHNQTATPIIKIRMPGIVDPNSHHEAVRTMVNETTAIQMAVGIRVIVEPLLKRGVLPLCATWEKSHGVSSIKDQG